MVAPSSSSAKRSAGLRRATSSDCGRSTDATTALGAGGACVSRARAMREDGVVERSRADVDWQVAVEAEDRAPSCSLLSLLSALSCSPALLLSRCAGRLSTARPGRLSPAPDLTHRVFPSALAAAATASGIAAGGARSQAPPLVDLLQLQAVLKLVTTRRPACGERVASAPPRGRRRAAAQNNGARDRRRGERGGKCSGERRRGAHVPLLTAVKRNNDLRPIEITALNHLESLHNAHVSRLTTQALGIMQVDDSITTASSGTSSETPLLPAGPGETSSAATIPPRASTPPRSRARTAVRAHNLFASLTHTPPTLNSTFVRGERRDKGGDVARGEMQEAVVRHCCAAPHPGPPHPQLPRPAPPELLCSSLVFGATHSDTRLARWLSSTTDHTTQNIV